MGPSSPSQEGREVSGELPLEKIFETFRDGLYKMHVHYSVSCIMSSQRDA